MRNRPSLLKSIFRENRAKEKALREESSSLLTAKSSGSGPAPFSAPGGI